ncbi:MAG: hypothetical protein JSR48_05835 [Verrucomicrobia bacterium]|nr:hypothetical protein [Verrucomicrobiota bacterium]
MEKPWKVIAAFVGIFVAGLLVGGLVTLRVVKARTTSRMASTEQYGPFLMKRLVSRLDLTPAQQTKIQPMVDQAAEELHQVRRKAWSDSQAILERIDKEISAELTPAQQATFEKLQAEQRERIRRFRENRRNNSEHPGDRPPPPPPPK